MSKRKVSFNENPTATKISRTTVPSTKYSLDSDEEDDAADQDTYLDENDIEGEEDGVATAVGEERFTAFNMREELEEGHFDQDGHFIWKNEKEVRDNWLDNIDWQKIRPTENLLEEKTLGDESESDEEEPFEEIEIYKKIITYMQPKETINKSLSRLGKNKKLSSIERLRRKKAGLLDSDNDVIVLTELADKILSATGNMDIYQETFESVTNKIESYEKKNKSKSGVAGGELDMYSDDFDVKEKQQLKGEAGTSSDVRGPTDQVMWELKRDLKSDKIEGPYNSQQMLKFSNEGNFKTGVWARRCSENSDFYSTNRIDFELYL